MEERELASYGLTEEEARIRRQQGKGNVVSDSGGKSNKQIVVEHLLTYFNLVFGVLAALLIISGSNVKNLTFLVVVVINTAIGAVQQIKAKRQWKSSHWWPPKKSMYYGTAFGSNCGTSCWWKGMWCPFLQAIRFVPTVRCCGAVYRQTNRC